MIDLTSGQSSATRGSTAATTVLSPPNRRRRRQRSHQPDLQSPIGVNLCPDLMDLTEDGVGECSIPEHQIMTQSFEFPYHHQHSRATKVQHPPPTAPIQQPLIDSKKFHSIPKPRVVPKRRTAKSQAKKSDNNPSTTRQAPPKVKTAKTTPELPPSSPPKKKGTTKMKTRAKKEKSQSNRKNHPSEPKGRNQQTTQRNYEKQSHPHSSQRNTSRHHQDNNPRQGRDEKNISYHRNQEGHADACRPSRRQTPNNIDRRMLHFDDQHRRGGTRKNEANGNSRRMPTPVSYTHLTLPTKA